MTICHFDFRYIYHRSKVAMRPSLPLCRHGLLSFNVHCRDFDDVHAKVSRDRVFPKQIEGQLHIWFVFYILG